ncbi:MAG: DEAD/DEAH box helicase [Bacteroidetes bacterium]|nr:DEAD/DEAH box helicase [Bacteroidota bacterium]
MSASENISPPAPGSRVEIRDAEWIVRRVDRSSSVGFALTVTGVSELVRDRNAIFLTELEPDIRILDPARTRLVADASPGFRNARLYLEALLRQTPPTHDRLAIGDRAAMDTVAYQREPALTALRQPRQRVLIADAVGLGKTLEAGILLAELMRRGRARRILVITMKSMLAQFQKEMWSRFAIPLTRLDSVGIQRIRGRIPANHNPFYHFDKSIISIDTLKQDQEYRAWLESSRWDVIVIDEAHAVAHRGARNLRHRLAKLLAERSDALIMLTATPHDGKPRSFASLMNMLDPTAIADPDNYGPDDIRGLFIRRHKKDIRNQVLQAFRERTIATAKVTATPAEEQAFTCTCTCTCTIGDSKSGDQLFRTTLLKAFLSSPAALIETVDNRLANIAKRKNPGEFREEVASLTALREAAAGITDAEFSKYRRLLELLQGDMRWAWKGTDARDRLVIFTERIATLQFLRDHLISDLGLEENQVEILHGGMPDVEQMRVVEDFGKDGAPVRLLLASDVASEGINLHYLSHRMIHFDIPWSLIRFQQRNGRIDRYGQEKDPMILYMLTDSVNDRLKGDTRILELLIEKDQHVHENIGDPVELTGIADVEEEERRTAAAMAQGLSPDAFAEVMEQRDLSFLEILMNAGNENAAPDAQDAIARMLSLYRDDWSYAREAMEFLHGARGAKAEFDDDRRVLTLEAPKDLRHRFRMMPREVLPDDHQLALTDDVARMQEEVRRCRQDEEAWPKLQYLWELHPVFDWINDALVAQYGRHEAPVLVLEDVLEPDEHIVVLSCLIPNLRGQPLIQHWCGVVYEKGKYRAVEEFADVLVRTGLPTKRHPNTGRAADIPALEKLLADAVERGRDWMSDRHAEFVDRTQGELAAQSRRLQRLREKQQRQIEQRYGTDEQPAAGIAALHRQRREQQLRDIERIFTEYQQWIEDSMTAENQPYIRIAAVVVG